MLNTVKHSVKAEVDITINSNIAPSADRKRTRSRSDTEGADFGSGARSGVSDYQGMPPLMGPATGVIQPPMGDGSASTVPLTGPANATLESKIAPPKKNRKPEENHFAREADRTYRFPFTST